MIVVPSDLGCNLVALRSPENESPTALRHVCNYLPVNTASHPERHVLSFIVKAALSLAKPPVSLL